MTKRRLGLVVSSVALLTVCMAFSVTTHPFIERSPEWLQGSWFLLFITTFIFILVNLRSWYVIIGIFSLLLTIVMWISV
jgi:hypothetical protein